MSIKNDNKQTIAAFFDIDGTIYRNSLLIEHFKMLVKYEFIDMISWESKVKQAYINWTKRSGDYDTYLEILVETYVEALRNLKYEDMDFIAKRVIELKGNLIYKYTLSKIEEHKKNGHKVILISGSPSFLVAKMAQKWGIEDYKGAVYKVDENGIFTGEVIPMYDSDSKIKAIEEYRKKYNINLDNSYSYGDTTGDLTMLKATGNPVAINPARRLIEKIQEDKKLKEKMTIIVERKDVIYKLNGSVEII